MLNYFFKIPTLIKIILIEFIAVFCLGRFIANILSSLGAYSCLEYGYSFDWYNLIFLALGLLASYWLANRIWRPRVLQESWQPTIKVPINNWTIVAPNPALKASRYAFPSTNPSYMLVDLLVVGVAYALFYVNINPPAGVEFCSIVENYLFALIGLVLSGVILLFRVFVWYILKRRLIITPSKDAWLPVAFLYGLLAVIGIPIALVIILGS